MEQKIISLNKGIRRNPTSSEDGELIECVNLISKNGEIMNAPVLHDLGVEIPEGYKLVYIHETDDSTNYILSDGRSVTYMREGETDIASEKVDEAFKVKEYERIVTPANVLVKATREQIKAISDKLAITGDEDVAKDKMDEYENRLDSIIEYYINAYDGKNSTNELEAWGNLSPVEKYRKVSDEDYEQKIIFGSSDVEDTTINLYLPNHTWYAVKTNNGNWLVGEGKWVQPNPNEPAYVVPTDSNKAQMLIKEEEGERIDDDGNTVPIKNFTLIRGHFLEDKNIEGLLGDNERIEGEYTHAPSVIGIIYVGNFKQMNEAVQSIVMLTDEYYSYYMIMYVAENKDRLQQELSYLTNEALPEYERGLQKALDDYNTIIETKAAENANLGEYALKLITSIGNILVITGEDSIGYCLWESNGYTLLKNHIPELTLNFNLTYELIAEDGNSYQMVNGEITKLFNGDEFVGQPVRKGGRSGNVDGEYWFDDPSRGDDSLTRTSNQAKFDVAVQGAMAKIIQRYTNKNKFIMPFLVRYALKMYDGSNIMASSPILMVPSSGLNPVLQWRNFTVNNDSKITKMKLDAYGSASELEVCAIFPEQLEELGKWKDVIKGVDIYISSPFYRFKQASSEDSEDSDMRPILVNSDASTVSNHFTPDLLTVNRVVHIPDADNGYSPSEGYLPSVSGYYGLFKTSPYMDFRTGIDMVPIPVKTQKEVEEEIKVCNNFYHIKYYPIADIPTTRTKVEMKEGTLRSLVTRKMLTDDYQSHDTLIPGSMKVLNGRLSLANYKRVFFDGFNPYSMFAYSDGTQQNHSAESMELYCVVYIRRNGKNYKVTSSKATAAEDFFKHPKYIYYPDICAISVEVHLGNETRVYKLSEHEGLNGAYYFSGIDGEIPNSNTGEVPSLIEEKNSVNQENYVCTSKVNNPYVFEAKNYSKVGNGKIKTLEVNTMALSQGQFGQHPLLAFASDGIWALEMNSVGEYVSVQPLSRDILLDRTKPCQTDNAIIFATIGGLKGLAGSQINNISDNLDGMIENNSSFFEMMKDWQELNKTEHVLFNKLMEDCQLLYDNANSLIHVYSEQLNNMHYVMSLESGEWSRMTGGVPYSIVQGYPYSVIQDGRELFHFKKSNDDKTDRLGLFLTREVSFDNPIALKMLYWLRVMRKKYEGTARVIIYVSNDRENWKRLKSLKSRSWKWYRFAVFTRMTDVDAIEGIICGTEERWTNRPR